MDKVQSVLGYIDTKEFYNKKTYTFDLRFYDFLSNEINFLLQKS